MEELWQRVSQGHHTALVGIVPGDPPASLGLRVIRVRCDVPPSTLGPLVEARRKIERLLGGEQPLLDQARSRVVSGLRRRLLGDVADAAGDSVFIELFNRLAHPGGLRYVLVFDAVEAADEATLETLRRLVQRPDALRIPLVLSFLTQEPLGAAGALLAAVRGAGGPEAVLRTREGALLEEALAAGPASRPAASWRAMPAEALRVLRAGALIGSGFEPELLGALLGMDELEVLEALQLIADAGVPLQDAGEGRLHLPAALTEEIRASILPSLARAWHRRLATLLSEAEASAFDSSAPPAPVAGPVIDVSAALADQSVEAESYPGVPAAALEESRLLRRSSAPPPPSAEPAVRIAAPEAAAPQGFAAPPPPDAVEAPAPPSPAWVYEQIYAREPSAIRHEPEPAVAAAPAPAAPPSPPAASPLPAVSSPPAASPPPAASSPRAPESATPRSTGPATPPRSTPAESGGERASASQRRQGASAALQDEARAASHLSAAGDLDAAAKRYCAAAAQAVAVGAFPQALAHAQRASSLLDNLPSTPERRRMRVRTLMEMARVHWLAAAPSPSTENASFTLGRAFEILDEARATLAPDDPAALYAELATLTADVCYDLGDLRSLERALEELSSASRRLLDARDATGAARLLNDQAALYVRLGDPVRAAHLLGESRKVFEERAATDPVALLEMAETDHLFARIPLHVAARPGREDDALTMGLDHAIASERTYKRLGASRELSRVWETMGRIELRRGRLERATERLSSALELQQTMGDLVGLARSTAALSEVLAAMGRHRDALMVLSDSVGLNLEKGSPIGLAFNRRALDALASSVSPHSEAGEVMKKVAAQLARAESILGRMKLSGEPG